jgi:hypothetical protein
MFPGMQIVFVDELEAKLTRFEDPLEGIVNMYGRVRHGVPRRGIWYF